MQCNAIICIKGKSQCLVQRRHPVSPTAHHTKTSFLIDWSRTSLVFPTIWTVLLELFLSSKNIDIEILHASFIKKKKKRKIYALNMYQKTQELSFWHYLNNHATLLFSLPELFCNNSVSNKVSKCWPLGILLSNIEVHVTMLKQTLNNV